MFDLLGGEAAADGHSVALGTLAAGLTPLVGGEQTDKVEGVFRLVDADGDGVVSEQELVEYLVAVYTVMMHAMEDEAERRAVKALGEATAQEGSDHAAVDPLLASLREHGVRDVAMSTAALCMEEADLNHDDSLSHDEFVKWYTGGEGAAEQAEAARRMALRRPSGRDLFSFTERAVEEVSVSDAEHEAREVTRLGEMTVRQVYEACLPWMKEDEESASPKSGRTRLYMSRDGFQRAGETFAPTQSTSESVARRRVVLNRLYDAMDRNGDGRLDQAELMAGLSTLCGGDPASKLRATFDMFDEDGDHLIELGEMITYLRSVFAVMFKLNDGARVAAGGRTAEELAKQAAGGAFVRAGLPTVNRPGLGLTLEQFAAWAESQSMPLVDDLVKARASIEKR